MTRTKKIVVAAVLATAVLMSAPAAWAHVTVNPSSAPREGFAKLAFRVPNERDAAGTTAVEINFPAEQPLAFVSVKPTPGWTFQVEKAKLAEPFEAFGEPVTEAVSKITWTGGRIAPGEFQEFEVSVGPLPADGDSIVFKAVQTYENGEVVRWIEEPTEGGEEPEFPAPVLVLTEAQGDHGGDSHDSAAGDTAAGDATPGNHDDGANNPVSYAALGVGALGLVLSLFALARKPRPS